jgi:sigma-B regulation protein RsbU (phosphoserine phosphatase)
LTFAMRSMIRSLRHHTLHLESEVAARTKEMNNANVELERALHVIQDHQRSLQADLDKARLFQEKMLPRVSVYGQLDIAMHHVPLERVSGDIFDVCEITRQHVRVLIADVTGHGVQACMRTIVLKSAYDRIKIHHSGPDTALSALNRYLVEEFPDGDLHCAALCVDLHRSVHGVDVVYVNAGAPPLFVFSKGSPPEEYYLEGPLLGVDEVAMPEPRRWRLQRGQLLLMASDGLTEQGDPDRRRFESELKGGSAAPDVTAADGLATIIQRFEDFRGSSPVGDDVTAIAVMCR